MSIIKEEMTFCICNKCKHKWIPQDENELPLICPKCKSPRWNKEKKK